jgi:alginate O-acetyltransferase complex protein AlgI
MLFTNPEFLIFLLITFALYYLPVLKRHQVQVLILASLIFYGYYIPVLLLLLLFSLAVNATASYLVYFKDIKHKKTVATLGVIINLLLLIFFKYSRLLAHTVLNDDSSFGHFLITLPLPIGISFFTFEGITLLVDTYKSDIAEGRKKIVIDPNPLSHLANVGLFISFFPHLISGPILKAYEFFPQIQFKRLRDVEWEYALRHLIIGYFLKMVIADNLKEQTYYLSYPEFLTLPTSTLIIQIFGYSMQIFADFAGYSLIALGLASLFGYKLIQNFNFPYISTSFSEFWKRWHISLSTFLKEYLYFPLGGNQKGKVRTYFNLLMVMFLGGLWHGAAWSYAVWGLFHGLALAVERLFKDHVTIKSSTVTNVLSAFMVFVFVSFAWLLFKLPNFDYVIQYFHCIANNSDIAVTDFLRRMDTYILLYSLPVVLYHFHYLYQVHARPSVAFALRYEPVLYGIMLFLIFTNSGVTGDFIYFQF